MKRKRTTVDHGMDWATEAVYQMGPCIVKYTQTEKTEEDIQTELTGVRGFAIVHTVDDVFRRVNDNPYDAMMGMYFYPYRDEMADVKGTPDEELFKTYTHTGICTPTLYGKILEVVADGIRYGLVWDDDPERQKWGVKMQMRVIEIQAHNFARFYRQYIAEYLDGERDDPKGHIENIIDITIDHYKGKLKGKRARPNQIGYIAAAELARDEEIIAKLRAAGRLK